MDAYTALDKAVSVVSDDPGGDIEEMLNGEGTSKGTTFDEELIRKVGISLIKLELDLAFTSEKLVNMNLLMMHVAARESDFETFASEKENALVDSAMKALEFDVLSGIFDSEVREMDYFVNSLQREIKNACEIIFSHKHLGDSEAFLALEEKLHDAEETVVQSQEQVSELRMQSANFQRILPTSNRDETLDVDKDLVILEDGEFFNTTAKIKMQTSEEQRNILRMLEKSLARELDLERKLTECTQAMDEMKLRLCSSKQEVLSLEEETAAIYAQFLEADNASVVLMGISKELVGQLQSCQLKYNCAVQRESELNTKLQNSLQAVRSTEKESALSSEQVKELQVKTIVAETRAERAETECKLLAETKKELAEELDLLKASVISREKVHSLEEQLVETNSQLQQAVATVEASQEKQSMLYASINDMEILIEKLKSKVAEADARTDAAEDKCIVLSENNAELNEELNFWRGKLECLEGSLQRAEEMKLETAKNINIRTKMITDMIMQLAIEREQLHKQIYSLMSENKAVRGQRGVADKGASKSMNFEGSENEKGTLFFELRAGSGDTGGDNHGEQVADTKVKSSGDAVDDERQPNSQDLKKPETVGTIDPRRLGMKYIVSAILIAALAVLAVCFLPTESCPF